MSLDRAKRHLEKYNLSDNIIILKESSATVREAALALNTEEERIAKTLSFLVSGNPILILAAGDRRIDNAKFKTVFHEKAHMIGVADVENLIGHAIGGVCPFGINEDIKVYLDESLKEFDIVYPAAGTSNSAVKLTIEELEIASEFEEWIDVTKGPNNAK